MKWNNEQIYFKGGTTHNVLEHVLSNDPNVLHENHYNINMNDSDKLQRRRPLFLETR